MGCALFLKFHFKKRKLRIKKIPPNNLFIYSRTSILVDQVTSSVNLFIHEVSPKVLCSKYVFLVLL